MRSRNDRRSLCGMIRSKKLHDMETAKVYKLMDTIAMDEHLDDPKQSTPRPRSDLPKNKTGLQPILSGNRESEITSRKKS